MFTYSGHGTQTFDVSGEEGDTYDEAIYVYDGMIVDDDLRAIIDRIDPLATLVVISDSCFSGSVTRLVPEKARPRFLPIHGFMADKAVRLRFLLPESGMPEILISGCSDSEYSYDAEIDGRYNGAMSAMALRVIRQNPGLTYSPFYTDAVVGRLLQAMRKIVDLAGTRDEGVQRFSEMVYAAIEQFNEGHLA